MLNYFQLLTKILQGVPVMYVYKYVESMYGLEAELFETEKFYKQELKKGFKEIFKVVKGPISAENPWTLHLRHSPYGRNCYYFF